MTKTKDATNEVDVIAIDQAVVYFHLLGSTPLIFNRMSQKVRNYFLLPPPGRMTSADKAGNVKHNPIEEYRASVYRAKPDGDPGTRLVFPATAFKSALCDVALDLPGMKKTQIGRLCQMVDFDVSIYGIPQLSMAVVRGADMNRTPDIRTRALVPQWACRIGIKYTRPLITQKSIVSLMSAAGVFIGIGDHRQQKGKGSNGLWDIVDAEDKTFQLLVKNAGRKAQDEALESPALWDEETEEMFSWYGQEIARRGREPDAQKRKRKMEVVDA